MLTFNITISFLIISKTLYYIKKLKNTALYSFN